MRQRRAVRSRSRSYPRVADHGWRDRPSAYIRVGGHCCLPAKPGAAAVLRLAAAAVLRLAAVDSRRPALGIEAIFECSGPCRSGRRATPWSGLSTSGYNHPWLIAVRVSVRMNAEPGGGARGDEVMRREVMRRCRVPTARV